MMSKVDADSIFQEIESTFRAGSHEKRAQTLLRVADLFEQGAGRHSEKAIMLFDDVMGHLIKHVESRFLVELSSRLAKCPTAPVDTVRQLAHADSLEVARPLLMLSEQLSDDDLIDIAETKSQEHLATIAIRKVVSEAVTEALVDNGDANVANEVARNSGARLSNTGMAKLVISAESDDRLTESISRRADISPSLFRQLLIQATDTVRRKLADSANPAQKETIRKIMDGIAMQIGNKEPMSRDFTKAQKIVAALAQDTESMKSKILEFADASRHAETIAALSVLSGVPIGDIDRLFQAGNTLSLTVLCKSIALNLDTAFAVTAASDDLVAFDDFCRSYEELSVSAAQRILRFWQGRQKVRQHFSKGAA